MKRVTIEDVASLAKVSKSTVSQYLNKRFDYMGEDTRLRVEEAIHQLGYQPNIIARSLKQKRTSTIGVIVANILHSFSTQVIRSIEDTCRENDVHVIVCNADDDPKKEENYINMLRAKQVDGMIIFPTGGNIELYQSMVYDQYPVVFVDRIVENVDIDTILLDNESASKMAVEYLLQAGHQRIAIITPSLERKVTPRIERINGYKKALQMAGLPIRNEYIKSLEIHRIHSGLEEMFAMDEVPTAIIAGNDLSLLEILRFVKKKGIKIPDDLSVLGFDEVPFATIFEPSLTTISQPAFEMGKKAAEILLERIEGSENEVQQAQIHRFPPTLLKRDSTSSLKR
ncbi:LacI family DNA-binding transcriptional regulator [Tepidibacillus decaturensis]|uniref:LacI family transcriptional regulator n=1 Tax=Tepidibacillus decaturensis TaxID=1413211 RepID=A0A135L5X9_9BACI|nr:substrate-binding domain-containing protein [Tepidibacillus decaturensis]KXG44371.1 LacI family transcriptional regulator [Tepidibacillus decaturensis]